jgi:hypothetical protein
MLTANIPIFFPSLPFHPFHQIYNTLKITCPSFLERYVAMVSVNWQSGFTLGFFIGMFIEMHIH